MESGTLTVASYCYDKPLSVWRVHSRQLWPKTKMEITGTWQWSKRYSNVNLNRSKINLRLKKDLRNLFFGEMENYWMIGCAMSSIFCWCCFCGCCWCGVFFVLFMLCLCHFSLARTPTACPWCDKSIIFAFFLFVLQWFFFAIFVSFF